jgi:hypothetical protein
MTQTRGTEKKLGSWSFEQDLNPVPPRHEAEEVYAENT